MKILDVNNNPLIHTFSHLFIHAIVSGKNNVGEEHAKLKILSNNSQPFKLNKQNSEIIIKENEIQLYADIYEKHTKSCLYRTCNEIDELIIKVEYQQYVNPWGIINIFIKKSSNLKIENFDCLIGKFCNNVLLGRV